MDFDQTVEKNRFSLYRNNIFQAACVVYSYLYIEDNKKTILE
jgi:hypothetical protein